MVRRYFPVTKFFPTRKGANTVKKMLQDRNPSSRFKVEGNFNKTAFRVLLGKDI